MSRCQGVPVWNPSTNEHAWVRGVQEQKRYDCVLSHLEERQVAIVVDLGPAPRAEHDGLALWVCIAVGSSLLQDM
jgi:hypothetical protein